MPTYVFPGQGAQTKGMGADLFSQFPDLVQSANKILGYSIETICLENPDDKLNQTQYTQPALFIVNALAYLKKIQESPRSPDFFAGHSLGEYNALFAAGVFDFETGLRLVQERGRLMSQVSGGGMGAVIGLKAEDVQKVLSQRDLKGLTIANYNSYLQIVVAGPQESISKAAPVFEAAGARMFIPLQVSGAFHSPYMQSAQQAFEKFIQPFNFASPAVPVIANLNARPYPANDIQGTLVHQITRGVQWTQTIEYLLDKGQSIFEEVGPGRRVLTGLIAQIQKARTTIG